MRFLACLLFGLCFACNADSVHQSPPPSYAIPDSAYTTLSLGKWSSNSGYAFTSNYLTDQGNGVVLWMYARPAGVVFSEFEIEKQIGLNPISESNRPAHWFVDEEGNGSVLTSSPHLGHDSRPGIVSLYQSRNFQVKKLILDHPAHFVSANIDAKGNGQLLLREPPFEVEGCCPISYFSPIKVINLKEHEPQSQHRFNVLEKSEPFLDEVGNGIAVGWVNNSKVYTQEIKNHQSVGTAEKKAEGRRDSFRQFKGPFPGFTWEEGTASGKNLHIASVTEALRFTKIAEVPLDPEENLKTLFLNHTQSGLLVTENEKSHTLILRHIQQDKAGAPQILALPTTESAFFVFIHADSTGRGLLSWRQSPKKTTLTHTDNSTLYAQAITNHRLQNNKIILAQGNIPLVDLQLTAKGNGLLLWGQEGTDACNSANSCKTEIFGRIIKNHRPLSRAE